jgi:hypothetical protein
MIKRTKAQWHELFKVQQASGQTNAAFCRQYKLNAKYYSLRKRQLGDSQAGGFVLAKPQKEALKTQSISPGRLRIIDIELRANQLDINDLAFTLNQLLR